jgi:hypothetical protein
VATSRSKASWYRARPSGGCLVQQLLRVVLQLADRLGADAGRLEQHHADAPGGKLLTQRLAQGGQGALGGGQRADERWREPGADRADHDDPAACLAQQRQQRLGDGELPGDVDLQQPPELLGRDELQRAEHADAGVVDQPVQSGGAGVAGDGVGGGGDLSAVGDVQQQGRDLAPAGGRWCRGVSGPPDACKDVVPGRGQLQGGGPSDA